MAAYIGRHIHRLYSGIAMLLAFTDHQGFKMGGVRCYCCILAIVIRNGPCGVLTVGMFVYSAFYYWFTKMCLFVVSFIDRSCFLDFYGSSCSLILSLGVVAKSHDGIDIKQNLFVCF